MKMAVCLAARMNSPSSFCDTEADICLPFICGMLNQVHCVRSKRNFLFYLKPTPPPCHWPGNWGRAHRRRVAVGVTDVDLEGLSGHRGHCCSVAGDWPQKCPGGWSFRLLPVTHGLEMRSGLCERGCLHVFVAELSQKDVHVFGLSMKSVHAMPLL